MNHLTHTARTWHSVRVQSLIALLAAMVALLAVPASASSPEPPREPVRIVSVGDSITEGGNLGRPRRFSYPARIASDCGPACKVTNLGLGGTCLVTEECVGEPLVRVFEDEVLSRSPQLVVVSIGVNDMCHARPWEMKAGFQKLQRQARRAGVPLLLATIPPQNDRFAFRDMNCDAERVRVNEWLRGQGGPDFDGVLSTQAGDLRKKFDSGDGVHPSRAGYMRMARELRRVLSW